mmetsp:Transcript_129712/g.416080  ORF Transcript_129712/g.416080 Transcript_129712/m.416080 type:complete len:320 (+) Transcript_129712:1623-2582(+)
MGGCGGRDAQLRGRKGQGHPGPHTWRLRQGRLYEGHVRGATGQRHVPAGQGGDDGPAGQRRRRQVRRQDERRRWRELGGGARCQEEAAAEGHGVAAQDPADGRGRLHHDDRLGGRDPLAAQLRGHPRGRGRAGHGALGHGADCAARRQVPEAIGPRWRPLPASTWHPEPGGREARIVAVHLQPVPARGDRAGVPGHAVQEPPQDFRVLVQAVLQRCPRQWRRRLPTPCAGRNSLAEQGLPGGVRGDGLPRRRRGRIQGEHPRGAARHALGGPDRLFAGLVVRRYRRGHALCRAGAEVEAALPLYHTPGLRRTEVGDCLR